MIHPTMEDMFPDPSKALIVLPIKTYEDSPDDPVHIRINNARERYYMDYGKYPTRIFISVDLIEELLIEMLPGVTRFRGIEKNPMKKNEIQGMLAYRVIEPGIICVC